MWPTTLDMTRDECRGVLRRLELESYSNVISTFRAQGGLSDTKVKILEDLRNVFHISQERHRAEARRAANDEQLSTIADTISGPNTGQEWCREGRRNFPLLPRAAPLTALSAVANGVAEAAAIENSKLPYPAETANLRPIGDLVVDETKSVVLEDPAIKLTEEKKNLKRSLSLADHISSTVPAGKKRTISGDSSQSSSQTQVHTNTRIQQLYHNHSKTQSRHKRTLTKKAVQTSAKKPSLTTSKSQPTKIINKQPVEAPTTSDNKPLVPSPRTLHTYASLPQSKVMQQSPTIESEIFGSNKLPQIATSKKDITNNLSKLNLSQISQQTHPQNIFMPENDSKLDKLTTPLQKFVVEDRSFSGAICDTNEVPYVSKINAMPTPFQSGRSTVKTSASTIMGSSKQHIKLKMPDGHQNVITQNQIVSLADNSSLSQEGAKPILQSPSLSTPRIEDDINSTKMIPIETLQTNIELPSPGTDTKKFPVLMGTVPLQRQNSIKTAIQPAMGTKPKIQITSQQIINPVVRDVKLPTDLQSKTTASTTNRKSFKIISAPGKMYIQSYDNANAIAKLGTTVSQKSITGTPLTTNTTIAPGKRVSVQKVQILPNTLNKSVTMSKPNVIYMHTSMGGTPNSSAPLLKPISVVRNNKVTAQVSSCEKPLTDMQFTTLPKAQNNVFVIGAIQSENISKDDGSPLINNNIITEDTPVDILTTPVTGLDNSSISHISKDAQAFELKPALVRSISLNAGDLVRRTSSSQDLQILLNNNRVSDVLEINVDESAKIKEFESKGEYVIGTTTDWEMELDQEANKTREANERLVNAGHKAKESGNISELNTTTLSDDNFNDVIEEETIDGDNMLQENTTEEEDGDYDVSYGSANEEIDENVAIEYVDETGNSEGEDDMYTEKLIHEYKSDNSECNIIPQNNNTENRLDTVQNMRNNNKRYHYERIVQETTKNSRPLTVNTKNYSGTSTVLLEMEQIDENGLKHVENISEIMATGQMTTEELDNENNRSISFDYSTEKTLSGTSEAKKSISK